MAQQIVVTHCGVTPVQVWARLGAEQRVQVIRLMAQLAFKLVLAQPNSPLKEVQHAVVSEPSQNSG
jgi:hypothetical protein